MAFPVLADAIEQRLDLNQHLSHNPAATVLLSGASLVNRTVQTHLPQSQMLQLFCRFYAGLNDFLPPSRRQLEFSHWINESASIKDVIESLGVPHPEVDLILVNGVSVGFDYLTQDCDRISAYPHFHRLDIHSLSRVRPAPYLKAQFVLDVHLGKLVQRQDLILGWPPSGKPVEKDFWETLTLILSTDAALATYLRLLGFDALYRPDYDDQELAQLSSQEQRILLTQDRGLLKRSIVTHGYIVRSSDPEQQAIEVLDRFSLQDAVAPLERCPRCNGMLTAVDKATVVDQLPPLTRLHYDEFARCQRCQQVYWKGAHYDRIRQLVSRVSQGHLS